MRRGALALALALALLQGGCGDGGGPKNLAPSASLTVDHPLKATGSPFLFDASASSDPDGAISFYHYLFADGTPEILTASRATSHAYASPGVFTVQLTVVDDDGAEAAVGLVITVVEAECSNNGVGGPQCDDPFACLDGLCQCPNFQPPCGLVCCDTGLTCVDGACITEACSAPLSFCPGWGCVDLLYDNNNCGGCGRMCDVCELGECRGGACDPQETFCNGVGCVDLQTDPANCGFCGTSCPEGVCRSGSCGAPGTVLEAFPAPPYQTITGMTYFPGDGAFYLMTGRRFVLFEPTLGLELGNWFLADEAMRRAVGLAADPFDHALLTGAYDRFTPGGSVDLEAYNPFFPVPALVAPDVGGPVAFEEATGTFWVFANQTQELLSLDRSKMVTGRHPVAGLDPSDRFTDLASDGAGGVWAVRPNLEGLAGPAMKKISLESFRVVLEVEPPDPAFGIGGVVLVDGALWGAGRNGVWRMVP